MSSNLYHEEVPMTDASSQQDRTADPLNNLLATAVLATCAPCLQYDHVELLVLCEFHDEQDMPTCVLVNPFDVTTRRLQARRDSLWGGRRQTQVAALTASPHTDRLPRTKPESSVRRYPIGSPVDVAYTHIIIKVEFSRRRVSEWPGPEVA